MIYTLLIALVCAYELQVRCMRKDACSAGVHVCVSRFVYVYVRVFGGRGKGGRVNVCVYEVVCV